MKYANKGTKLNPIYAIVAGITICISLFILTTSKPYLAMAPGLGLIFFFLISRNLELGYFAIIFLLPFAAYRNLGGIEYLRMHWILAFSIVFVIALQMISNKHRKLDLKSRLWLWLLPYFSVSLVVSMYSEYPQEALKNVVLQAVAYLFIALGMILVTEKGYSRTLPKVLITSISAGSLSAAIGFFFNVTWFAEKVDGGFKRGLGVTTDPNSLSMMVLFVMPFLAYMFISQKHPGKRLLALLLVLINLLGLVTTYSRGGVLLLIMLVAAIGFTYMHLMSARYVGLIMALIGFIVVGAISVIPPSYWERQVSLVSIGKKDISLKRRASYLIVGWERFVDNPVFGSGTGVFKKYYAESKIADKMVRPGRNRERPAHNTYLEVLVGGGLLSLFLFLGALGQALLNFNHAIRKFIAAGKNDMVMITRTYRMSFVVLSLFLFLFSDLFQKYLLVSFAMSQVALRLSQNSDEAEI
ncbi:O-antigen ligase family protein [Maridesulfovibrio sp.]|uniref:O-antigen ligase family protein n=1 Tax=Maridesulfovibrio sp. TaxID=2795000 RepID=UPI003BADADBA